MYLGSVKIFVGVNGQKKHTKKKLFKKLIKN